MVGTKYNQKYVRAESVEGSALILSIGVELMCHEMEKIYSEGMESGEKRGELKKAKETALSMAEEGMDVKMIARLVKVSEKDVQKWIDETLCVTK